jgi:two-component system OmpR family sensor kinase
LWYTALLSATLVLFGVASFALLERGLRDNVDRSLDSVAQVIVESVRRGSPLGPSLDDLVESMFGPTVAQRFFRLLDPHGRTDPRVVPRGRVQLPLSVEALRNAGEGRATYETARLAGPGHPPVRVLTAPVLEPDGSVRIVQVAMSLEAAEGARARFLYVLAVLAPLALGVAAAGGWALARRALAPVDAMVEAARRIGAEDLSQRLVARAPTDELGRLAGVLNDMLGRLQSSFDAVQQFSADAAHELRTPLTILKGEIEVALRSSPAEAEYRRVLQSCLEEVDRLSGLVQDMLFLARSDSGNLRPDSLAVDISEVATEVGATLRALADARHLRLSVTADPNLWVTGSRSMLFRLVFNLGENAIAHTPAGGAVDIELHRERDHTRLTVRDTGPGIAPAERARIFDRFYRGDPARERGGTGLGLALVKSIVALHQGTISVDSPAEGGANFQVDLPLVATPAAAAGARQA